jgi:hypothetical protein
MAKYDPDIIHKYADQLNTRADLIIVTFMIGGLVIGFVLGGILGGQKPIILAAIGGGFGFVMGTQRAFILRLLAQTALCQVQIEINTRSEGSLSKEA